MLLTCAALMGGAAGRSSMYTTCNVCNPLELRGLVCRECFARSSGPAETTACARAGASRDQAGASEVSQEGA